jgi:hypothetical protein
MNEQVRDLLSTRTVSIRFPDGDTEFWLTDQIFSARQTIASRGREWLVAEVLEPIRGNGHWTVTVRDPGLGEPEVAA